jgi:hypothetical protein|eukprot:SAG25_NODE_88_length_16343_cov_89.495383_3_plen_129_part_00
MGDGADGTRRVVANPGDTQQAFDRLGHFTAVEAGDCLRPLVEQPRASVVAEPYAIRVLTAATAAAAAAVGGGERHGVAADGGGMHSWHACSNPSPHPAPHAPAHAALTASGLAEARAAGLGQSSIHLM